MTSALDIRKLAPDELRFGPIAYVSATAPPGGDGLTLATAFQTLGPAFALAHRRRIRIYPGVYDCTGLTISPDADRGPTALIAMAPGVRLRETGLSSAWTLVTGTTYQASTDGTDHYQVIDLAQLAADGYGTLLTTAASLIACEATPGSMYIDTGLAKLYVNRVGGSAPDTNLLVSYTNTSMLGLANYAYLFDGITFEGSRRVYAVDSTLDCKVWSYNCQHGYQFRGPTQLSSFGACYRQLDTAYRTPMDATGASWDYNNINSLAGIIPVLHVDVSHDAHDPAASGTQGSLLPRGVGVQLACYNGSATHAPGYVVLEQSGGFALFVGTLLGYSTAASGATNTALRIDDTVYTDHAKLLGCDQATAGSGTWYDRGSTTTGTTITANPWP